ncbi:glycosyltransferase [Lentibacter algarum]|uniref:glycosyltransferase n=1 Tax=Lentibacter algarum TaxID=576131 RepID=UPI001C065A17|nr:glycosyltransferase [Lentibacter algarum]MBU2980672.1 glycosyltransferase [Lentibacter algarum]
MPDSQPTSAANGLVALVVTYNRFEALKVTVRRLLAEAPDTLGTLLVCNNASTDGTADWLKSQTDPRLEVLDLPHNIGGAGGFEAGLRHAAQTYDADWYLLMDDDARPVEGTLARFLSRPRSAAQIWISAVRYPDGEVCEMNRPWLNPFGSIRVFVQSLLRGRDAFHLSDSAYAAEEVQQVDGGSFVGQFVSREALALAGFPRGELFIYADDVLYTLALRSKGGKVAFDASLAYEHDCKSLTRDTGRLTPLWKVYFYHRNISLVYRRVAGPLLFWPVLALKYLQWRRKAGLYGADKATYVMLLNKAVADARANRLGNSLQDITALITSRESSDKSAAKA